MILRILRGRAARDDVGHLVAAVRTDIADWASLDAGLLSAQAGFQPTGDDIDFLLASIWTNAEAVLARGGEITLARGRLGATGLLHDGRGEHYELMLGEPSMEDRPAEVLRLSSMALQPRRSSAFYQRVRVLCEELEQEAGLAALHVGRRAEADVEKAVVVSVWESAAALEANASGGFVRGDEMAAFYASEPVIEDFTVLPLDLG